MKKTTLLTVGLILLLAAGLVFVSWHDKTPDSSISSFAECVAAGYSVDDSYPERCSTPDGKRFVQNLPDEELPEVTTHVTITGEITCLPHWDTSGPQTLECALGLESDAGDYYTLAGLRDQTEIPSGGQRVTLSGRLIPGSDARYQSVGQIEVEEASVWTEQTTAESGVTFQYPETPGGEYLEFTDWPPQVQVLSESLSCSEAGSSTARSGETTSRTIDGQEYCVTVRAEGAAGSTYHQYAYLTDREERTLSLTFSTRQPQCGNYPEGQRAECEREQEVDIDGLVEDIMQTLE